MQQQLWLSIGKRLPLFAGAAAWVLCAMIPAGAAFAADHGHAAEASHESSGLPQFDPSSFSSQVFWLLIAFGFLYVFFSRKTLPSISSVIGNRREQIVSDREMAEQIRNEADNMIHAYEKGLETARAESMQLSADAVASARKAAETALNGFQQKAEAQMSALESRLGESKNQAMDEMNIIAAEIASQAAEKIVGIATDINQAQTVVRSLNFKMSKAA